jgi:DNA adenine methylase
MALLRGSRQARAHVDARLPRELRRADGPRCPSLRHVSLECRPALDVIRAYGDHDEVLLYCDPPYLGTTRSSRQYGVEMSADAEHQALAEVLHDVAATVVLSGYASPLYEDLYASWHRHELAAFTGQAGTNGRRVEVLWSNRPLGQQHDLFSVTDHDDEAVTA